MTRSLDNTKKTTKPTSWNKTSFLHSPWNSFRAALTEVTIFDTWPSTVAKRNRPNSSWAITNTYSLLLLGLKSKETQPFFLHQYQNTILLTQFQVNRILLKLHSTFSSYPRLPSSIHFGIYQLCLLQPQKLIYLGIYTDTPVKVTTEAIQELLNPLE